MTRIGLITKLWSRPALTRVVLDYYANLAVPGVELVLMAAHSPGQDKDLPEMVEGWGYVSADNDDLSEKGNAACRALRGEVDAVVNIGSDDLLSVGYLKMVPVWLNAFPYVNPTHLHYYDLVSGKLIYRHETRLGAGRAWRADLLDDLDWSPFLCNRESGYRAPDVSADNRLTQLRTPVQARTLDAYDLGPKGPAIILDIKGGGTNFADFAAIDNWRAPFYHAIDDSAAWLRRQFPTAADALLALSPVPA